MTPAARRSQRGVAVVLAMGVVALAAMAAGAMLASQSTWARQAELSSDHVQAQVLVRAGVDWARALLGDDRLVGSVDHLGEAWALRLPPVPVDNGELTGQIDDQQGRFNLNNLLRGGTVNPVQLENLRRLLAILDLPGPLGASLAGWLEAAKRPLTDQAELAVVPGFDDKVRARLRPFVSALPRFTAVNANTAPAEVLSAIVRGLGVDDARALVEKRERAYFRTPAEFVAQLPAGAAADPGDITVSSQFFVASVRVTIGASQARGTALLSRESAGWPAVVWRKYP